MNNEIKLKYENHNFINLLIRENGLNFGDVKIYTLTDFINENILNVDFNNDDVSNETMKIIIDNKCNNNNTICFRDFSGDDYYILLNFEYGKIIFLNCDYDYKIIDFPKIYNDFFVHDETQYNDYENVLTLLLYLIYKMFNTGDNSLIGYFSEIKNI